jgi:hypothetical protein
MTKSTKPTTEQTNALDRVREALSGRKRGTRSHRIGKSGMVMHTGSMTAVFAQDVATICDMVPTPTPLVIGLRQGVEGALVHVSQENSSPLIVQCEADDLHSLLDLIPEK